MKECASCHEIIPEPWGGHIVELPGHVFITYCEKCADKYFPLWREQEEEDYWS